MPEEIKEILSKHSTLLEKNSEMLDQIMRGVYGDEANNFKGLLQRQNEDEERWEKLAPVIDSVETIPAMVSAYRFMTDKKVWGAVASVAGMIWWASEKWATIQAALFTSTKTI